MRRTAASERERGGVDLSDVCRGWRRKCREEEGKEGGQVVVVDRCESCAESQHISPISRSSTNSAHPLFKG